MKRNELRMYVTNSGLSLIGEVEEAKVDCDIVKNVVFLGGLNENGQVEIGNFPFGAKEGARMKIFINSVLSLIDEKELDEELVEFYDKYFMN